MNLNKVDGFISLNSFVKLLKMVSKKKFFDSEFAKLKSDRIDLISIALIKVNGEEL
ncbi:MAG: hypothetical protein HF967_09030 [Methanosarcinales archaeon]|nr:hypothetical protein [Methanosarcinales archaeon]